MRFEICSPDIGPIIGHTTSHDVRIWVQSDARPAAQLAGVAALYGADGRYRKGTACYFKLERSEERAGIVVFSRLDADTAYRARLAVVVQQGATADDGQDEKLWATLPAAESFVERLESLPADTCVASFRTFPATANNGVSFILGSCRYPGLLWPARKADRIFASIQSQCQADPALKFVLMNGDQIYAERLASWMPLFKADTPAEYRDRYVTAFTTPGMRSLLRTVPAYMILDDHEIEDNWNSGRHAAKRELYDMAMAAYRRYQWLHSPRNFTEQGAVAPGAGNEYFYSYECADYPFFVMDSRSKRVQDDDRCSLAGNHLLGDPSPESPYHSRQLALLCDWLKHQQQRCGNRPKFVVSPSTFAPNAMATAGSDARAQHNKCKDDAWAAFPATRRHLLRTILDENIQNVIFLCGDAHGSCVAEISFQHKTRGKLPLVMHSITASAFYWPWPFANGNPDSCVHDSAVQQDGFEINAEVTMHYRAYGFEQANNFTRVDIGKQEISVQHYGRDGRALAKPARLKLVE